MMCMLVCKMVWVTGFTDNLILRQAIIYKYIVYKIINFDIYIYIYIYKIILGELIPSLSISYKNCA